MRIHVTVKFICKEAKLGNKLRSMGNELDIGETSKIDPNLFPTLSEIYSNPPKICWNNHRWNEFKYSKTYGILTIYLNYEGDAIKSSHDTLIAIIKELMCLTGVDDLKGARISSTATVEECRKFTGLDSLPEIAVTIGDKY